MYVLGVRFAAVNVFSVSNARRVTTVVVVVRGVGPVAVCNIKTTQEIVVAAEARNLNVAAVAAFLAISASVFVLRAAKLVTVVIVNIAIVVAVHPGVVHSFRAKNFAEDPEAQLKALIRFMIADVK